MQLWNLKGFRQQREYIVLDLLKFIYRKFSTVSCRLAVVKFGVNDGDDDGIALYMRSRYIRYRQE